MNRMFGGLGLSEEGAQPTTSDSQSTGHDTAYNAKHGT